MRAITEAIKLMRSPMEAASTPRGQKQRWLVCCCVAAIWFAIVASALLAATVSRARGQEILQFGATWCGPCRQVAPLVNALHGRGLAIRHVDIDIEHDLAASRGFRFGVDRVPLFIAYDRNGREVKRAEGVIGETEIVGMLQIAQGANQEPKQASTGDASIPDTPNEPPTPIETCAPWGDARIVKIRNFKGPEQGGLVFGFFTGSVVEINGEAKYVISCAHGNYGKGDPVWVVFNDGKTAAVADTLAIDRASDCSLLKLRCEPRKDFFRLGSEDTKPGEKVWLGGFENGNAFAGHYATCSGFRHDGGFVVNVPSIEGQSGGPVVTCDGVLIGVIDATNDSCSFCCSLTPIRRLLDDISPNRSGAIIPRVTPPPVLVPVQPQQVLPAPTPSVCDPKRLGEIESRLKALEVGKQDKGDYATRGDIPTIPTIPSPPDLSGLATKQDLNETHKLLDKVVAAIEPAIDARLAKLPIPKAAAVATHVLGVPTALAAPIALIGGPAGVALSLVAIAGYRRLAKRQPAYVTVEHAAAGGRRGDGFHYGDQPVAGRIVPRDANGNPI